MSNPPTSIFFLLKEALLCSEPDRKVVLTHQLARLARADQVEYDHDGELVEVAVGFLYSTLRYMRNKKAQDIAKRICFLSAKLESRVEEA